MTSADLHPGSCCCSATPLCRPYCAPRPWSTFILLSSPLAGASYVRLVARFGPNTFQTIPRCHFCQIFTQCIFHPRGLQLDSERNRKCSSSVLAPAALCLLLWALKSAESSRVARSGSGPAQPPLQTVEGLAAHTGVISELKLTREAQWLSPGLHEALFKAVPSVRQQSGGCLVAPRPLGPLLALLPPATSAGVARVPAEPCFLCVIEK